MFRTELYHATSIEGPWTHHGVIVNGSNPSPHVLPNGTVVVAFKGIPNGLRIATAAHWRGPYEVLSPGGNEILLSPKPVDIEDFFIWYDIAAKRWAVLLHQYIGFELEPGGFAYSAGESLLSGWHFAGSNNSVYGYDINITDSTSIHVDRQRPKLLFGADGTPSYLYNGMDSLKQAQKGPTHTFVQRVRSWRPPYDTHDGAKARMG